MPHIDADREVLTLINTFTVAPENHDKLMKILDDATRNAMCKLDGFISASLHSSLDQTRVANYAQWRSVEHFRAAISHPSFMPHFHACNEIAQADPQLYKVVLIEEAKEQ